MRAQHDQSFLPQSVTSIEDDEPYNANDAAEDVASSPHTKDGPMMSMSCRVGRFMINLGRKVDLPDSARPGHEER